MVATTPTPALPTLSKPDRLRLTLYFATVQSVESLALELNQIHFHHQRHVINLFRSRGAPAPAGRPRMVLA